MAARAIVPSSHFLLGQVHMADIEVSSQDATQVLTPAIWPTGSHVRLLTVPWDSAYRDVVAWESAEARDAWFAKQSGSWFASNFQNIRPGEPISVPVPYSSVYRYNYIVVTNPQQPVEDEGPARSYFYFVTGAQYLSPQATRLTVQLDVMTTYAGGIKYGRAYVDRGHIAMANANAQAQDGQTLNRYLSLPEGVDVGSEYVPCAREFIKLESTEHPPKIVIISTANLAAPPGTTAAPNLNVADGQIVDGLPSGCNVYWCPIDTFKPMMDALKDKSWVAQCIIAIYAFPGALLTDGPAVKMFGTGPELHFCGTTSNYNAGDEAYWDTENMFGQLAKGLGDAADVRKLYSYPYSVIELSTLTGNPVFLKPNLVRGDHLAIQWLGCVLAPFAKAGFFPENYGDPEGHTGSISYSYIDFEGKTKTGSIAAGDFLDTAVWVSDFPQFSFVNNNYLTYLASTTHARQYQYQSAGWQLSKANLSAYNNLLNQNDYADAMQIADTNTANARLAAAQNSYNTVSGNNITNMAAQMAPMGIAATLAGGPIGVGTLTLGALASGSQYMTKQATANADIANANTMSAAAQANAGRIADMRRGNAGRDYNTALQSNQGDYQNAIAGINATVQDAALTPPSTVGQAGGQGFNYKNGLVGITVTYKTLSGAARDAVADYFRRYGYSVRRYLTVGTVRHMLCMTKFAYWRLVDATIVCGAANESERETMRGIAEKGVTLWDAPESIGHTAATDNAPRSGYAY